MAHPNSPRHLLPPQPKDSAQRSQDSKFIFKEGWSDQIRPDQTWWFWNSKDVRHNSRFSPNLYRYSLLHGSINIPVSPLLLQKVFLVKFSDIWSLGIILYEMCNLRLPFEAQHYNALAMKILQGSYPSIMPTYSKQLRDLISSMLSKKPQDRPSIIDVLNKSFIRTRT